MVRPERAALLAVTRERREDSVGELPEPGAGRLVVDDLHPEWLSAEEHIWIGAGVVEPGRILRTAGL